MTALAYRIIALLVSLILSGAGGWSLRGWKEGAADLAAERRSEQGYIDTVKYLAGKVQEISAMGEQASAKSARDRVEFQRRLSHARTSQTSLVKCDPAPRLTGEFVGLWNHALDIGLPKADGASQPESGSATADPPGIDDLLENLGQNGEACNKLRQRAIECKAWAESLEKAP